MGLLSLTRRATLAAVSALGSVRQTGDDGASFDTIATPRTESITQDELEAAVFDVAPDDALLTLKFSDGEYYAPVPDHVDRTTGALAATSRLPYRPETFDCDNYAGLWWALTALTTGVNAHAMVFDWEGEHAYNLLVDAAGDAHVVEPATESARLFDDSDNYAMERALVVF